MERIFLILNQESKSLNIKYLFAGSKEEYVSKRDEWLKKSTMPVLFEIFTDDKDESEALRLMNTIAVDTSLKAKLKKSRLWKSAKKIIRG